MLNTDDSDLYWRCDRDLIKVNLGPKEKGQNDLEVPAVRLGNYDAPMINVVLFIVQYRLQR